MFARSTFSKPHHPNLINLILPHSRVTMNIWGKNGGWKRVKFSGIIFSYWKSLWEFCFTKDGWRVKLITSCPTSVFPPRSPRQGSRQRHCLVPNLPVSLICWHSRRLTPSETPASVCGFTEVGWVEVLTPSLLHPSATTMPSGHRGPVRHETPRKAAVFPLPGSEFLIKQRICLQLYVKFHASKTLTVLTPLYRTYHSHSSSSSLTQTRSSIKQG